MKVSLGKEETFNITLTRLEALIIWNLVKVAIMLSPKRSRVGRSRAKVGKEFIDHLDKVGLWGKEG